MKKYFVYILMGIILLLISSLIIYTIVSKRGINNSSFNIKVGDKLEFKDYNTTLEVQKVSSTLNDKNLSGEIEVIVKAIYADNQGYYTLKSKTNNKQRIKNSNNYIILTYENDIIKLDIKDRYEV